jgi:vacuolar iron transporter family protein
LIVHENPIPRQQRQRSQPNYRLSSFFLGTCDGIVFATSLLIGVAAAGSAARHVFIAGVAALIAGSMAMAAREYISTCSRQELTQTENRPLHELDSKGVSELFSMYPFLAALASAASFALGAVLPLALMLLLPAHLLVQGLSLAAIASLAVLSFASAKVRRSAVLPLIGRVVVWGTVAMLITALVGSAFNAVPP